MDASVVEAVVDASVEDAVVLSDKDSNELVVVEELTGGETLKVYRLNLSPAPQICWAFPGHGKLHSSAAAAALSRRVLPLRDFMSANIHRQ